MRVHWKTLFFVCLLGFIAFQHYQKREIVHVAGEIALGVPLQNNLDTASTQNINGYEITPSQHLALKRACWQSNIII